MSVQLAAQACIIVAGTSNFKQYEKYKSRTIQIGYNFPITNSRFLFAERRHLRTIGCLAAFQRFTALSSLCLHGCHGLPHATADVIFFSAGKARRLCVCSITWPSLGVFHRVQCFGVCAPGCRSTTRRSTRAHSGVAAHQQQVYTVHSICAHWKTPSVPGGSRV